MLHVQVRVEIRQTIITCKKNRTKLFHQIRLQGLSSSNFPFSFFTTTRHTTAGVGMGLTEKCSPPPSMCCLVMGGGGDWKKLCISEGRGFAKAKAKGFPPLLEVSRPCAGKTK
jgi:hypothetical protein